MNREIIIQMARQAGGDDWGIFRDFMSEIERFAILVAAVEREACAQKLDAEMWITAAKLVRERDQA
jgi:hypothetical protein